MNIVKKKLVLALSCALGAVAMPSYAQESTSTIATHDQQVVRALNDLSKSEPHGAEVLKQTVDLVDRQQQDIATLRCQVAALQKQLREHAIAPAVAASPGSISCDALMASSRSTAPAVADHATQHLSQARTVAPLQPAQNGFAQSSHAGTSNSNGTPVTLPAMPTTGSGADATASQAAAETSPAMVGSITLATRDITRPQAARAAVDGHATSQCGETSFAVNAIPALPALSDQMAADAYLASLTQPGQISAEPGLPTTDLQGLKDALHRFIGRPVDSQLVQDITRAATVYVTAHTDNIVNVFVPPQALRNGNLVVVLAAAKLGGIRTEGQKHISPQDLACQIHMRNDDPVNLKTLTNDLTFLNTSPWRQVNSSFTPGANPGDTDLILHTVDRYPLRVYGSWDNTGTELTGMDRFRAGVNWGDAFGVINSRLDYSFTWSDTFHQLKEHTLLYTMPVGQRDTLTFTGDYSSSDIPIEDGYFTTHGKNIQAAAQWTHLLGGHMPGGSQFLAGFEYKRIGDTLLFNDNTPASNTAPNLYQFYAGVQIPWVDRYGNNLVNARFTFAPGFDNNAQFNAARKGATADYRRFDLTYDRYVNLPDGFSLHGRFNGQWASGPLIASEQLQISGAAAVRGYREDALLGDSGYTVNLEVLTPALPVVVGGLNSQLQGVVFYDFGQGFARGIPMQNLALGTTANRFTLASTGFGLRFNINPYLSIKSEVGWSLRGPNDRLGYIIHNSIVIAY
jgi:hemolysin activation/secretion protein